MDKEHKTKIKAELEDIKRKISPNIVLDNSNQPIEHNNIEPEVNAIEELDIMRKRMLKMGHKFDKIDSTEEFEKLKKLMEEDDFSITKYFQKLTGISEEHIKKYGMDKSEIDEFLTQRYKDKFPQSHESLYDMDILNNIELPNFVDIEGIKKPKSPEQPSDGYKGRKPK